MTVYWKANGGGYIKSGGSYTYCDDCPCEEGGGTVTCNACEFPETLYAHLSVTFGLGSCPCAEGVVITLDYDSGTDLWYGFADVCGCDVHLWHECRVRPEQDRLYTWDSDDQPAAAAANSYSLLNMDTECPPVWASGFSSVILGFNNPGGDYWTDCPGCSGGNEILFIQLSTDP